MTYPTNRPFLNHPPTFDPSRYNTNTYSSLNQGSGFRPPSFDMPKMTLPSFNMPKTAISLPPPIKFSVDKSPSLATSFSNYYRPPISSSPGPSWGNSAFGDREISSFKAPHFSSFQSSASLSGLNTNSYFSLSPPKITFSDPAFQAKIENTWRQMNNNTFSPTRPLYTQQEYMFQNSLETLNRSNALGLDRLGNQMVPSLSHSFIYQQTTINTVNSLNGQITSFSGKMGNFAFEVFTPVTNQNRLWTFEVRPITSDPLVRKMMENTWRQVYHGSFSPEYPIWRMSADNLETLAQTVFEKINLFMTQGNSSSSSSIMPIEETASGKTEIQTVNNEKKHDKGSFWEGAKGVGAMIVHQTFDGVAEVGRLLPQINKEMKDIGSWVLPKKLQKEFSLYKTVTSEDYEKTVIGGHRFIDQMFSVNQAEHYSAEVKERRNSRIVEAYLPPPSFFFKIPGNTNKLTATLPKNSLTPSNPPLGGAYNRAAFEEYKVALRAEMEKPYVVDLELQKIVNHLYKPGASIGSGSTAAAIRQELATGERVRSKLHSQKGKDTIIALKKWLKNNPTARSGDRAAAENMIKDLRNALGE